MCPRYISRPVRGTRPGFPSSTPSKLEVLHMMHVSGSFFSFEVEVFQTDIKGHHHL